MKIVLLPLFFFLFSCGGSPTESLYLPESLPSEETIKETLSSDSNLFLLNKKAASVGKTLQEWKEWEKSLVTDKEINVYWQTEKKHFGGSFHDTDTIDHMRESIRMRIVWSRIFHITNLSLKQKPTYQTKSNLLSKLKLQNSPRFGKTNSKWVIVEWSDYLCGFCKQTFPYTKKLLSKYKSEIDYIHKDFPLDGDSDESLIPLAVSRCLWEKDPTHFSNHMELLYQHAKKMTKGENIAFGQWDFFDECNSKNSNARYLEFVKQDWEEAKKIGVSSVPTFWVNGRWIVGALDSQTWEKVLKDTKL